MKANIWHGSEPSEGDYPTWQRWRISGTTVTGTEWFKGLGVFFGFGQNCVTDNVCFAESSVFGRNHSSLQTLVLVPKAVWFDPKNENAIFSHTVEFNKTVECDGTFEHFTFHSL